MTKAEFVSLYAERVAIIRLAKRHELLDDASTSGFWIEVFTQEASEYFEILYDLLPLERKMPERYEGVPGTVDKFLQNKS
jgi:hypothetical protein